MQLTYESKGTSTFLVYTMEESEVLDSMSMGMLENNHIKGILPLSYSQEDEQRYIRYNISSKVSLSQYFNGVVNRARLIQIMSSLADAVMNAEDYMLEASAFLWDKEYIFVDAGTAEAFLVCVPVEGRLNVKMDMGDFFRRMVMGVTFDASENCDYVARLIGFFNSSANFSLSDFSRTLKEIGTSVSLGIGDTQDKGHADREASIGASVSASEKTPGDMVISGGMNVAGSKNAAGGMNVPGGVNIPGGGTVPAQSTEPAKKKGFSLFGSKEPKEKTDKRDKKDKQDKKDKKGKKEDKNLIPQGMAIPGQAPVSVPAKKPAQTPVQGMDNDDRTEILDDRTEILEDKTEVLGEDIMPRVWLELLSVTIPGLMPRIDLNFGKPFITLGRLSSDENQPDIAFPRDLKRIGRQHARIERRGSEFYVIDLGSANHTLLNDEILTPNQPYLLKEGMELAFTTNKLVSYRIHTM